ncbi:uncharacterized protein KY384_001346 [Bacidia gigantensis]|uniref:uncharacterized protein n=1 Tax=Bacidia gigantensis TaxID=2732470 RepID=UPI001D0382F9|nr:uncharacterized protein KY384_001346 [Bacidia gigantensis]KAG8533606.1 hypothetical protein KY384_001346 [Bacidia gigantensis]
MAPTTTGTPSPAPTKTAATTDWSEYIGTIATSLTPLLTLFGELATKQFLSVSMGWADNILLAMGPIGIITIVVSAIRIGGSRAFKAIIGRSREARVTAEQEFLSSTSDEVCELWSGRGVVRVTDKPTDMKDLVILRSTELSPRERLHSGIIDINEAWKKKLFEVNSQPASKVNDLDVAKIALQAPCIALNVGGTIIDPKELWFWALIGVLLQSLVLIFPALATYDWKLPRKGVPVPKFAYACFVAGTVSVVIGLLGCGHVVEASTTDHTFKPSEDGKKKIQRILRVQKECTVGGQHFPAFAIVNHSENKLIRTSRLNARIQHPWLAVSTLAALAGYIVQFVGIGSLHWSATIAVLGCSVFMTVIRAWVRRGLARDPICLPVPTEEKELVWLGLHIGLDDWEQLWERRNEVSVSSRDCEWGLLTGFIEPRLENGSPVCDSFIKDTKSTKRWGNPTDDATKYVRQLNGLSGQLLVLGFASPAALMASKKSAEAKAIVDLIAGPTNLSLGQYAVVASKVAAAMDGIMKTLIEDRGVEWKGNGPPWSLEKWQIEVQKSSGVKTDWFVSTGTENAKMTDDLIAGLSLWMYSLMCGQDTLGRIKDDQELKLSDMAARAHVKDENEFELTDSAALGSRKDDNNLELSDLAPLQNLTPGVKDNFIRIVGNTENSTIAELESWIKHGWVASFKTVPCYGNGDFDRGNTWTGRKWPVFGLYYSASFTMQPHPSEETQQNFTFRAADVKPHTQDIICPAEDPLHSVEIECALEILSLFMLSISMCVKEVKGNTRSTPHRITNSLFEALADQIVKSQLVEDIPQALVYVIPAFAKFGLLPKVQTSSTQAPNGTATVDSNAPA